MIVALVAVIVVLAIVIFALVTNKLESCSHYNARHSFMDLHRGNESWYVRGYIDCKCGFSKCIAIPVPKSLQGMIDNADKEEYYDEIRAGKYRKARESFLAWRKEHPG